ncbi:TatD family hydrolase [Magnetofaba australis]|uniref:Putative TatD-related deoxyribonuclease n=1 Tax=Magnetofaba australis IT-1 TaxID=1434232 RepID=A0A1Y2K233_9PROT|nr:TatD family hydrolase [Magnetofaba australis]OSM01717.1 putative TatD-related deoxyribonuclease [Magnetofaba australis IT-1]
MIDCHAHIADDRFDADRAAVLQRAADAGVTRIVAVCERVDEVDALLTACDQHPMLRPALGLYPGYADADAAQTMMALIRQHRSRLAAIGEVGLDYQLASAEEQRALQREILSGFAALALELDLPLNVHSRAAGKQTIELLRACGATRVQMHAYYGPHKPAIAAAREGFLFSVPPAIARGGQMAELVGKLPLESLLLESDSPVLGPQPGERNEPANITHSLEAIAQIKQIALADAQAALADNTARLYGTL